MELTLRAGCWIKFCKWLAKVAFLIFNYITSRLVPLLKVIDAPIQVPNVLDPTVSFMFLNFNSHICLLFVPEMSANFTPYTVQIWISKATNTYYNLMFIGPCIILIVE